MVTLFQSRPKSYSQRRRKSAFRSLNIEQLESRLAFSAAPVVAPAAIIDYYNTSNMPITPTGETGIRSTGTPGEFFITGSSYQDGILFRGTIDGVGTSYIVNYTDGSGDQFITNVYGPDPLDATTLRLVGTFKNATTGSDDVGSFVFEGTTADFANPANYTSIIIPNTTSIYAHSTAGGLIVGNYYSVVTQGDGDHGIGRGFIYDIAQHQKITDIVVPGAVSTSVSAIWYNGGTSYTIAGGYSLGFVDDLAHQDDWFGTAFLADYDSATGDFSNWTKFAAPGGGNVASRFEGLSSVDDGIYTMSAVATPGLTTQPLQGYLVTVARAADGSFGTAVWTPLNDPAGTATSANSIYGYHVVGVLSGATPPGFQSTVNGDDAARIATFLADHQPSSDPQPTPAQLAALPASQRWNWLAGTLWYVPTGNMLAYTLNTDLTDPTAISDQTLWFIHQSADGQFTGVALVLLSSDVPQERNISGSITPDGQVRITFTSNDPSVAPTIGIGQARFVDGAIRLQMQMASGSESIIGHWAYQSQLTAGTIPPSLTSDASNAPIDSTWSWLLGTHWGLSDSVLLGCDTPGIFTIDSYVNGYFWGTGHAGDKSFNIFGSVTPEGNVLILASVDSATATSQAGFLVATANGGVMTLRSYEGTAGTGLAWSVPTAAIGFDEIVVPTDASNFTIPGRQASVTSLGQNALPATDVIGTWQFGGALPNAVPWMPVEGTLGPLAGVTRTESLEASQLGNLIPLMRGGSDSITDETSTDKSDADTTRRPKRPEWLPSPKHDPRGMLANFFARIQRAYDRHGPPTRAR